MSTAIKLRGGSTAAHAVFTGAEREVTVDTDKNTLVVHDGTTQGGFSVITESALAAVNGALKVGQGVMTVSDMTALLALTSTERKTTFSYVVQEFHSGTGYGGGIYLWDSGHDKAEHNGGTVIDPLISLPADWTNPTQVNGWLTAANSGSGCFVRLVTGSNDRNDLVWFGAKLDLSTDNALFVDKVRALKKEVWLRAGMHSWRTEVDVDTDSVEFRMQGEGQESLIIPDLNGYVLKYTAMGGRNGTKIGNFNVSNYGDQVPSGYVPANIPIGFVLIDGRPHNKFEDIVFQQFKCTESVFRNKWSYGFVGERIRAQYCHVGIAFFEFNQLKNEDDFTYVASLNDVDITGLYDINSGSGSTFAVLLDGGHLAIDKIVIQDCDSAFGVNKNANVNTNLHVKNVYLELNRGYSYKDFGEEEAGSPPLITINGWFESQSGLHKYDFGRSKVNAKNWRPYAVAEGNISAGPGCQIQIQTPSRYVENFVKALGSSVVNNGTTIRHSGTDWKVVPSGSVVADASVDSRRQGSFLLFAQAPANGSRKSASELFLVLVEDDLETVITTSIQRTDGAEAGRANSTGAWTFKVEDGMLKVKQAAGGEYYISNLNNMANLSV